MSASALSGWVLTALFVTNVAIPYVTRLSGRGRLTPGFAERMRTHFSLGVGIAVVSVLHAGVAVSTTMPTGQTYLTGIAIATIGLFLGFGQVALGATMRRRPARLRGRLRLLHLANVLALIATGVVHLLLNGPLVRALLHA